MPLIDQVPRWLSGQDAAPFRAVHGAYHQLMETCLDTWLARQEAPDLAQFLTALARTDARRHALFLLSPQTYRLLFGGTPQASGRERQCLAACLVAEHYLCDQRLPAFEFPVQSEYWTAIGDACFVPGGGSIRRHGRQCGDVFLDGTSALCTFDHELDADCIVRYDDADVLETAYTRVADAISWIGDRAPFLGTLVTTSLRSVVLHACVGNQAFFSGSRSTLVGQAGFVNAHTGTGANTATVYDLVDALLHEAVHALLYRLEMFEPIYTSPDVKNSVNVTSPWSGRCLKLHSFTHACFVWYALALFWARYSDGSPHAQAKYRRARDGFLGGDLTAPLRDRAYPYVLAALEEMQTDIGGHSDAGASRRQAQPSM